MMFLNIPKTESLNNIPSPVQKDKIKIIPLSMLDGLYDTDRSIVSFVKRVFSLTDWKSI